MKNDIQKFIEEFTNNFSDLYIESFFLRYLNNFDSLYIIENHKNANDILIKKINKKMQKKLKRLNNENSIPK